MGDLLAGRMAQTILISAWRMPRHPDNDYIRGWAGPRGSCSSRWRRSASTKLRDAWRSSPEPRSRDGRVGDLLARRQRVLGTALESLSYRTPLHLVRGDGAWMEAADGRRYLDAYNNVPVVGHAHPRVVDAIARQAARLNTNTRYLHEHVVELGERLVATMPDGLDTVLFVNSGSEANDLAWRLATTVTGADAGIATSWSYHGVTDAVADFSTSEWPRGEQPAGSRPTPLQTPTAAATPMRPTLPPWDGPRSPRQSRAWPSAVDARRRSSSTRLSPRTASSCPSPRS